MAIAGLRKWRKCMRDGWDRQRVYYQKIQGDMYVIHKVESVLLMWAVELGWTGNFPRGT